jgi:hypothetical protein
MFTKNLRYFWTNIASTMACPNFKNGPKNGLGPLGVNRRLLEFWSSETFSKNVKTSQGSNSYVLQLWYSK